MGTDKETTEKETTDQEISEKKTEDREDSIRRDYGYASDVELKECRYCRVMIPKKAKICPNCRMNLKRHWVRNTVAVIFAVAVIGVGGYYLSEHWGIMRDAVMSVWMAQDSTAVPAVSVTTVGTAEVAAGAASTETSAVAVNAEADKNTEAEASVTAGTETIRDNSAETGEKEGDLAKTSADVPEKGQSSMADDSTDTSEKGQSRETDETADTSEKKQSRETDEEADADEASEKEVSGLNTGEPSEEAVKEEKQTGSDDTVSEAAAGRKNTDTSDSENGDTTDPSGRKGSGSDKAKGREEEVSEAEDAVSATDLDEKEQAFRDSCVEVGYKALLRDAEDYLDTALKVELQVVCQVAGGLFDENVYYLCKVEEVSGIERYYIIRDDREADDTLILEGDTLTVYGQLFGNCKLPAGLIETRPTVPAVSMLYFDLK